MSEEIDTSEELGPSDKSEESGACDELAIAELG